VRAARSGNERREPCIYSRSGCGFASCVCAAPTLCERTVATRQRQVCTQAHIGASASLLFSAVE